MAKKIKPIGIAVPFQMTAAGSPLGVQAIAALSASIYSILLTTPGERVYRPTFGSWLRRIVFANLSSVSLVQAQGEIVRSVGQWEPRVTITGVSFRVVDTAVNISVNWQPSGSDVQETLALEFEV